MSRRVFASFRILSLVVLALVGSACDKSGLYPLFAKTDVLVPCSTNATTWVRSTATGTEILILGAQDPTVATTQMEQRCFTQAFVEHDSSTQYKTGSYTIGASGSGTASWATEYSFKYVATGKVLSREGSTREQFVNAKSMAIQFALDGDKLRATVAGVTGTYTNLYDVIGELTTANAAGAQNVFRVLNLPLFTSQVRIPGFGGAGMANFRTTTTFYSAIGGEEVSSLFTLNVSNAYKMPDTVFMYTAFEDLSGISYTGPQRTVVDLAGDGNMTGALAFVLRDGPMPSDVAMTGFLDYENVEIVNGVAGGGTYEIRTTMPTTSTNTIPFSFATDIDLRSILPAE